jgi:hypothetical protein
LPELNFRPFSVIFSIFLLSSFTIILTEQVPETAAITSTKANRGIVGGFVISILCVVYQALFRAIPENQDLMIGLPIAKEFVHPGTYSPYDLIVSSGVREPYHLYKYLGGLLYSINANFDLVWNILFLSFLFLTFFLLWFLSLELTESKVGSALVLALIAVAHPLRGSLNAAAFPCPAFVTTIAAIPFSLGAMILILRKRYFWAMALSGIAFDIHPYVGVLSIIPVGAAILLTSEKPFRARVAAVAGGGLLGVPNLIVILFTMHSNFNPVGYNFYEQFRLYAVHAFIYDHWREGYGWFFVNIAGVALFSRYLEDRKWRIIRIMLLCWFFLMAGYAFNSYVTKNTTVLIMFLFRATYFVKPIIFIVVVNGIHRWRKELHAMSPSMKWWEPKELSLAVALLFLSAIFPMKLAVVSDAMGLLAYGLILRSHDMETKAFKASAYVLLLLGMVLLGGSIAALTPALSSQEAVIEDSIVAVVVFCGLALAMIFRTVNRQRTIPAPSSAEKISTGRLVLVSLAVILIHHSIISVKDRHLPFVPDFDGIAKRIAMHRAPERTAALMDWARHNTPQQSLFVVPPDDWDNFCSFRLVAERGVYITCIEVNQLAYDATVYRAGHLRLVGLGVTIPSHNTFDGTGYNRLTRQDLHRLASQDHADYIVFANDKLHGELASMPTVYHDSFFSVIDLRASGNNL